MTRYFIGIGSNHQADKNCRLMINALRDRFEVVQVSRVIKTPAYGIEAPDYLNAVACFESDIRRDKLNIWCKDLEHQLGRDRQQTLCCADLDILLAVNGNESIAIDSVAEEYFHPLIDELLEAEVC